jgi:tetratricopeptide (TPR) repeat protein
MTIPLKQSHILIVDDFQGMRTMLREFVKAMGVTKIDTASTSKEAITLLSANKYDVVICDYNLGPGQNGQQILEEAKLRKFIGYSTIWIMVTAEKTMDMVMGAAETKPDDYLLKPINEAMLEGRLEKLIAKKQSLSDIEKAVNAQDYLAAIASCDQLMKTQPANLQDLLRIKSDLLLMVGDYDTAKALFDKILAVRSVPWARTGVGKIYFHTNEYLHAKEIFQEVLEENPMYMEASDWLSKTLDALGDREQAQQVLQKAMELSPNSPVRQKSLAEAAYKNGDLDIAQTAYEKTIKLSEHSVHKSPTAFSGLAKVHNDKGVPEEALKVLERGKVEFKDNTEAALQAAVLESMAYQKMGQKDKAEAAIAAAEKLVGSLAGKVSADVTMDMAKSLFQMGEKDKACGLLQSVVKNNHENAEIISLVSAVFQGEQLGEEGENLIKESKQEVININNQGVVLAREGKFEEAVKLLRTAVQTLPNSEVMIMNLCGMLIGLMKKQGKDDRLMYETKNLLARVREFNPANKKYFEYLNVLNQIKATK